MKSLNSRWSCGLYRTTFVSESVLPLLGYAPEDFINEPTLWVQRVHPEDMPCVFTFLPNLFEQGQTVVEYRFRRHDGVYRWTRDELRLVRDETGTVAEIIGCWIDITERKQLEEESQRIRGEL